VAIGLSAGQNTQSTSAIAIGHSAGSNSQGENAVAIGISAAQTNQGASAIAIGDFTANRFQGRFAIAIGYQTAYNVQASGAIAIGNAAGQDSQGTNTIAIGGSAGQNTQGSGAIAIGNSAGQTGQGVNSIAIGNAAGQTNQAANAIVLNASGSAVTGATANATYIAPLRNITQTQMLGYDTTTSEITYWTKTFVIDHPTNKNKYLVHGCLEGPEGGVYYRGKCEIENGESVKIHLPEYVNDLATDFTIQITPVYCGKKLEQLYMSEVENNCFTVYGENCKFHWLVHGKRCDIEVEPVKSNVIVQGNGPYKWI
jgi:hypothetical protein